MGAVEYSDRPNLDSPIMITAFRGWNDAGEAATAAAEFLSEAWGAARFATLDPEDFFDFQVTRPVVRLEDGVQRVIEWPSNVFHHASVQGRDVIVFVGGEPNMRWRTFATEIIEVGLSLGAVRLITLGAFLADVAHSRPVPIVGSAPPEEAERLGLAASRYEGPTGIVGVLHDISNRSGLSSVSFWGAVPHYVPAGENPKAALALVQRVASFMGIDVDHGRLQPASVAWQERINELVAENEALTEYVQRLEEAALEAEPEITPGNLPSGEAIAAEVEQFLREHGPGETP